MEVVGKEQEREDHVSLLCSTVSLKRFVTWVCHRFVTEFESRICYAHSSLTGRNSHCRVPLSLDVLLCQRVRVDQRPESGGRKLKDRRRRHVIVSFVPWASIEDTTTI